MSRSSELHLQIAEQEANQGDWFDKVITTIEPTYVKESDILKKMEATAKKEKEEIKLQGIKVPITVGVVAKITPVSSKFGFSWRINLEAPENTSFYLNSKYEGAVDKLFKVGEKAAFTTESKPNKQGKYYNIINQVFYTF